LELHTSNGGKVSFTSKSTDFTGGYTENLGSNSARLCAEGGERQSGVLDIHNASDSHNVGFSSVFAATKSTSSGKVRIHVTSGLSAINQTHGAVGAVSLIRLTFVHPIDSGVFKLYGIK